MENVYGLIKCEIGEFLYQLKQKEIDSSNVTFTLMTFSEKAPYLTLFCHKNNFDELYGYYIMAYDTIPNEIIETLGNLKVEVNTEKTFEKITDERNFVKIKELFANGLTAKEIYEKFNGIYSIQLIQNIYSTQLIENICSEKIN